MNQKEYEEREAKLFSQQLHHVEIEPLSDRKAMQQDWLEAMQKHPETVIERVGWLLSGSYGYGACRAALTAAKNPRINAAAIIGQYVAALEWGCPMNMARRAWHKLTAEQQKIITDGINREIQEALKEPTITI